MITKFAVHPVVKAIFGRIGNLTSPTKNGLVETNFPRGTTNQKGYPYLGSDTSSVWNSCARFSDLISRGNQGCCREMSAVFLSFDMLLLSSKKNGAWFRFSVGELMPYVQPHLVQSSQPALARSRVRLPLGPT